MIHLKHACLTFCTGQIFFRAFKQSRHSSSSLIIWLRLHSPDTRSVLLVQLGRRLDPPRVHQPSPGRACFWHCGLTRMVSRSGPGTPRSHSAGRRQMKIRPGSECSGSTPASQVNGMILKRVFTTMDSGTTMRAWGAMFRAIHWGWRRGGIPIHILMVIRSLISILLDCRGRQEG